MVPGGGAIPLPNPQTTSGSTPTFWAASGDKVAGRVPSGGEVPSAALAWIGRRASTPGVVETEYVPTLEVLRAKDLNAPAPGRGASPGAIHGGMTAVILPSRPSD